MKPMNISPIALPLTVEAFVTSTQAILATKGAGKSYTASVEAEELIEAQQQIVVLDPTGAWWGLRSNAAGDAAGYPIAVFGGDHGDAPLDRSSGRSIAEAIVTDGFSCILDVGDWLPEDAVDFVADFLETFYQRNRFAMHLFVDEADLFAPQLIEVPGQKRSLAALNAIVRRGRKRGIGCTMITQRAAVLNKSVLSQCDMLTALRMQWVGDIEAIEAWVKVHADKAAARAMMDSLPTLNREAWLWSPMLGMFQRAPIRTRTTFDSGRTPEAGERQAPPRVLAPVDVAKLGATIAAAAERAEDADVETLRRKLADARRELAAARAELTSRPVLASEVITAAAEAHARIGYVVAALTGGAIDTSPKSDARGGDLEIPVDWSCPRTVRGSRCGGDIANSGVFYPGAVARCRRCSGQAIAETDGVKGWWSWDHEFDIEERHRERSRVADDVSTSHGMGGGAARGHRDTKPAKQAKRADLSGPAIRVLSVLFYGERPKVDTAIAAGYAHDGGGFRTALATLRAAGYVDGETVLVATASGRKALGHPEPPPTAARLRDTWSRELGKAPTAILDRLLDRGPAPPATVARDTGYEMSGGGWRTALKTLRRRGLVTGEATLYAHALLTDGVRP